MVCIMWFWVGNLWCSLMVVYCTHKTHTLLYKMLDMSYNIRRSYKKILCLNIYYYHYNEIISFFLLVCVCVSKTHGFSTFDKLFALFDCLLFFSFLFIVCLFVCFSRCVWLCIYIYIYIYVKIDPYGSIVRNGS